MQNELARDPPNTSQRPPNGLPPSTSAGWMRSLRNARNGDVIREETQDLPPQMTTVPSSPPKPQEETSLAFVTGQNKQIGQKRPRDEDAYDPYAPLPTSTQRVSSAQLMPPPARRPIVREPKDLRQFNNNENDEPRNRTTAHYSPETSFSVPLVPVRHSKVASQGKNTQYMRMEPSRNDGKLDFVGAVRELGYQRRDVGMTPFNRASAVSQTPQKQPSWNGYHPQIISPGLVPPSTPSNPLAYTPRTASRTYSQIPDFYQNPRGSRLTIPPRESNAWDSYNGTQLINGNSQFLPLQTPLRTPGLRMNSTAFQQTVPRQEGGVRNTLNSLSFMNEPYSSGNQVFNTPIRPNNYSPIYNQRGEEPEYFPRPITRQPAAAFSYASQNAHLSPNQGVLMYGSSSSDQNRPNYPANTTSLRGYGRTLTGVDHSSSTRAGPLRNAIRSSMGTSVSTRPRMVR
jgi:hypothetical protein